MPTHVDQSKTKHRGLSALLVAATVGALGIATIACTPSEDSQQTKEVNVYSGRHYNTDKELYKQFTEETGIKVNLLEAKDDELLARLKTEGNNSPADVLVLVDAARLQRAQDDNLFQPIDSEALNRDVPAELRDPKGNWFALTRRARVIMVNPDVVNPDQVTSYADLTNPALKGKLCLRNRASVYNQSLVADVLVQEGEADTAQWVKGMVANVTQPLFTSDTPMLRALGNGECGVTVANQYYLARMLSPEAPANDRDPAANIRVVFPNPTHVNVTAAGVTSSSKNPKAATMLIEFLASPSTGKGYASANNEYPLTGFGDNPILNNWGSFTASKVSVEQLANANKQATELMAENGWK
ncbi:extracellular solute-binding protein [Synechococcus sp. CS-602]|uniref:extracellular solute-binding protein n=1 Tax=Synechococcaceae TaxID=1890426 RepID=UPI0008FF5518|nr:MULTISPECIES: extracellular solute-binding protein [Synechococcaceae]MCT4363856.1 extracellular solute-binding protein [Candidatus Regnicoccus frigidus MAG-AL1]APD49048.1 iron ABC transporter substrate-binding protein [Synechococcus sp. SynAce01]MCT0201642.1 extracellular solute-binding protein [Synechococcus sp. CS-603]MCT0203509.1 extracellular solute-binding protein [Synechococcus sp. CS-602]MCT0246267.1 extracellular solute-binding protein [Synechococcus sp. CS-601]